ncbi:MAG: hypothetical protein FK733_12195 [Asgard group archaeon]|nr:hypothetical protein [Asgard group archaeon]
MADKNNDLSNLIRWRGDRIVCTGGVVFIGEGQTGKTHTAMSLTDYRGKSFYSVIDNTVRKSLNLELDYLVFYSSLDEFQITTSSQIFIMPGQRGSNPPGEGLAFEDACDMYFKVSNMREVMALVLTYDLTDINTFQELEYWLERALARNLVKQHTSIIILGTHLDQKDHLIVLDDYIENARQFVYDFIQEKSELDIKLDDIHIAKVSNQTGEGIEEFKQIINRSFLSAFKIQEYVFNLSLTED